MGLLSGIPTLPVKADVDHTDPLFFPIRQPPPMTKLRTVGERIRYLRKTRRPGVVQAVVAEEIGMSRSYLSGIETGTEDPGRDILLLIADTFGGSLDWIEGRLDKVDMPEVGQFVKDPDKLALLSFWDALDDSQKTLFVNLLRHPPRRETG